MPHAAGKLGSRAVLCVKAFTAWRLAAAAEADCTPSMHHCAREHRSGLSGDQASAQKGIYRKGLSLFLQAQEGVLSQFHLDVSP